MERLYNESHININIKLITALAKETKDMNVACSADTMSEHIACAAFDSTQIYSDKICGGICGFNWQPKAFYKRLIL